MPRNQGDSGSTAVAVREPDAIIPAGQQDAEDAHDIQQASGAQRPPQHIRRVVKELSMDGLREMLAPFEDMDITSFEPATIPSEFVVENGKMLFRVGNQEYTVRKQAYTRLGTMLGIPGDYAAKTPAELMLPHYNHWLRHRGLPVIGFGSLDRRIEVFSRGPMNPVSNFMVLDEIEATMGRDVSVRHTSNDTFHTSYSILNQAASHKVKVGDIIRTGLTVDNSYAQMIPTSVAAYVERLSCTNGAVSVDNVFKFSRRGGGDGIDIWLKNAVRSAVDASGIEILNLQQLTEVQFDGHLSDALGSIFAEFGVPVNLRNTITTQIVDQGVDNMYDLYNLFTDMASNNDEVAADPALTRRLMRVGGHMAAHPEFCVACHRIMK